MKQHGFDHLKELLLKAADLPEEEREAYLDNACKDDPELRKRLESILEHDADPAEILKTDGVIRQVMGDRLIGKTVSHYRIIDELGVGGMGVVYKAEDTKLKRTVALKFLLPELMRDKEAKARFLREAQAAALLDHPSICAVHEIEESEDLTFIIMAYVEGETLRLKLKAGPLDLEEARIIGIQVSEGLEAAHAKGVIHRDIKPGNIMMTKDGQAKITDFGLAKFAESTEITTDGTRMGTIAYMSPEQARGDEVDHRSDIWSLGAVLYEMITGRRPFRAEHKKAVLHFILHEEPQQISALRRDAPRELDWIASKALAKRPDDRYQSARDMLADLRAVSGVFDASTAVDIPISAKPKPSIAVLPFVNMSGDPEDEYFSDGLAEDLINALSHIRDLRVVARTSAFSFKGKDVEISEIGRKLRVETLLEGSVRRANNQLRVTAQLVNAVDGYHVWSERYDRPMEDVFAIQDEISTAIVEQLKVKLLDEKKADLVKRHTDVVEAYELYLKGRYVFGREEFPKALEYFNAALGKDPTYTLPYVGIADALSLLSYHGYLPPEDAFPKAKAAAWKALEVDPTLGEAHAALSFIGVVYDYDWAESKRLIERARELSPNYEYTHLWCATYLWAVGKTELAKQVVTAALELDPVSLMANLFLGYAYLWARECDRAVVEFRKLIEMDPGYVIAPVWLGHTHIVADKFDDAINVLEPAAASRPEWTYAWFSLGWAYGLAGRRSDALKVLERLEKMAEKGYVRYTHRAFIHLGLEQYAEGFALFEKGRIAREADLAFLSHPLLDRYRAHPEFVELWEKMNLGDPPALIGES